MVPMVRKLLISVLGAPARPTHEHELMVIANVGM